MRNNWILGLALLLLLASVGFAQVAQMSQIQTAPSISAGFNLSTNAFMKAVIQGTGSKLDTPTTLSNISQIAISSAGQQIATLAMKSPLGPQMQFQGRLVPIFSNCAGTLVCNIVYEFTPTVPYAYQSGDFTPAFVIGNGSFSVLNTTTNYTYQVSVPTWGWVNNTLLVLDNATNTSRQITTLDWQPIGTHLENRSGWADISQLKVGAYNTALINLTVSRDSYSSIADVQPRAGGALVPQWGIFTSFWGSTNCTVGTVGANTTITATAGTCWVNFTSNQVIMYAVVSGGGSGGTGGACGNQNAGAGAAGGVNHSESFSTGALNYSLTVGDGGAAAAPGARGVNGSNSTFNSSPSVWISPGPGGGGSIVDGVSPGQKGGSGGGGGADPTTPGGHFSGQGNDGGAGFTYNGAGGGAGGYSSAGTAGGASNGGPGGAGFCSSISGSLVCTYACGGGGTASCGGGSNGAAGCGTASAGSLSANSADAAANSGSGTGGAGNGHSSGKAGSGIIILNWLPVNPANTTTVNYTGPAPTSTTYYYNTPNPINFSSAVNESLGNVTSIGWRLFRNGTLYKNGNYTCPGTPASCANNSNISLYNVTPVADSNTYGTNWTLEVTAFSSTSFANSAPTNSSNVSISKSPIQIMSVALTPLTSTPTYANATLVCTATLQDNDTYSPYQPINTSVFWYKNGVNQTALATTMQNYNGTANSSNISLPVVGTVPGDNWTCGIYGNDTNTVSPGPATNSTNTTISGFSNVTGTSFVSIQYDSEYYWHYLNFTLGAGNTLNSISLTINGTRYALVAATCTPSGANYNCSAYQSIPITYVQTTDNATWSINTTLANGTINITTTSYNLTANSGGILNCGGVNYSSNYTILDAVTFKALNATQQLTYNQTLPGGIKNFNSTNQSANTTAYCIFPSDAIVPVISTESYNASGYYSNTIQRPSQNLSNTTTNFTVYLTPLNSSATNVIIYVRDQNYLVVPGVVVQAALQNSSGQYNNVFAQITNSAGSATGFFFVNTNIYQFSVYYQNGTLIQTFSPSPIACNIYSPPCSVVLSINLGNSSTYVTTFNTSSASCTWSNVTGIIACTPLGNASSTTLNVYLSQNNTGGYNASTYAVCTNTGVGLATVSCTVSTSASLCYNYVFSGLDGGLNNILAAGQVCTSVSGAPAWGAIGVLCAFIIVAGLALLGLYFGPSGCLVGAGMGLLISAMIPGMLILTFGVGSAILGVLLLIMAAWMVK